MTPESTPGATPSATPVASSLPLPLFDAPAGGPGFPWSDALTALGIVVSLVLLWTRVKKIDVSSHAKAVVSSIELVLLIAGVVALGWPVGGILFAGVNGLAFLARSVQLYTQQDNILARAAAASRSTKPEMEALAKRLRQKHKVFRNLGPIRTAKLIDHLSDAARKIPEIEAMAPPVAHLWVMDRPNMGKLVRDFDRLMRLWRKSAGDATALANSVASAAQISPMTIQEAIDSMIAFAEYPGSTTDDEPESNDQSESHEPDADEDPTKLDR